MKRYYIVSLRSTSMADSAIAFWRPNRAGYCWYQNWAGIYLQKDMHLASQLDVFIDKEIADKLFVTTFYDGFDRVVLPNQPKVWAPLNLDSKLMRPKIERTCYMSI